MVPFVFVTPVDHCIFSRGELSDPQNGLSLSSDSELSEDEMRSALPVSENLVSISMC